MQPEQKGPTKETTATILLAEDSAEDVALFEWALHKVCPGNPLRVVRNGEQAILYLKGEGSYSDRGRFPFPGLMFLDLDMPIKTGLEVLAWIRQQPGLQKLPVIVLTATSFDSTIRTAYALGASSFVSKPPYYIDFAVELKQLTNTWLADASPSSPAAPTTAPPVSDASIIPDDQRKAA